MNSIRRVSRRQATATMVLLTAALIAARPGAAGTASAVPPMTRPTETATFSGGCFWSMTAIFERLRGVEHVTAGFSGGRVPHPSYERVCTGTTGHAETVQIEFDPTVVSYRDLLRIFFEFHDPTTPNRQGADVGEQYRSVIFWHTHDQEVAARQTIAELEARQTYRAPIVTQVLPFKTFYPAEDYHQAYFDKHGDEPYVRFVIAPKVAKLQKLHAGELKPLDVKSAKVNS